MDQHTGATILFDKISDLVLGISSEDNICLILNSKIDHTLSFLSV